MNFKTGSNLRNDKKMYSIEALELKFVTSIVSPSTYVVLLLLLIIVVVIDVLQILKILKSWKI